MRETTTKNKIQPFSTLQDEKQFVKLVEKYFSISKTHYRGTAKDQLGYAGEDLLKIDRQTAAFPLQWVRPMGNTFEPN